MTQRSGNNLAIATALDELFGLKRIYKECHDRIQSCFIMGNSRVNPPKIGKNGYPEPGFNCHTNQYGGLEGMRQKLWALTTLMVILHTGRLLNIDIEILGQGDNIVVLVHWKFYQKSSRAILRQEFLDQLEINFTNMGLTMKQSETWVSSRLFEYGKNRWLNGVQVSQGTKRASRVISDENDGLSTFESEPALQKIKNNPARIYNVDNTGLTKVQSKHSSILSLKGKRQIDGITSAERGSLITMVTCMNAAGGFVPSMLVFPRKNFKVELLDGAPPGTIAECYPSGWIQQHLFSGANGLATLSSMRSHQLMIQ
ncbi:Mononegavirales RNA dependent RNA polymerase [Popillia japonica]|uniref:Mononegavirales RNA dependent RNA polymerase n=1 Tax=Popillia japonica TaxID=7064 RepID=A0AAW1LUG2_POPJA